MPTDLGQTTSIDIIRQHLTLDGRRVLDIGCGTMTFSRILAAEGARVLALEPDPARAEANRAADAPATIEFREAGAAQLPAEDASADGAFFSFSLHHVPAADHAAALAEVRRVVRPDGFLCVIEPASGPLNDIMRVYDDEDAVRAAAQESLVVHARPQFARHLAFTYHSEIRYASFEDYAARHGGARLNADRPAARALRARTAEVFERTARAVAPDLAFASPKRMDLFLGSG
ncbi:MAG: class I SAM-dependent methyltransferase [Phycisphaerales bacterium]